MHVFFYDPEINNQKYAVLLSKIETKITDLGLGGKIIRLSLPLNLERIILNEIKMGQTLIFIGGDRLLNMALPILTNKDVVIGHIPISNKQIMATALGISSPIEACEIIAARRIIKLDIGQVNDAAFLTELNIQSNHSSIDIGTEINIDVRGNSEIKLINIPLNDPELSSSPDDELLELVIITNSKKSMFQKATPSVSYFQNTEFAINADNTEALLDCISHVQLPIKVQILPKAINFIVGKDRKF